MKKGLLLILGQIALVSSAFGYGYSSEYVDGRMKSLELQIENNIVRQRETESEIRQIRGKIMNIQYRDMSTLEDRRNNPCDSCGDQVRSCNNTIKINSSQELKDLCMPSRKNICAVEVRSQQNSCFQVYKNQNCYNFALTDRDRAQVDRCWKVRNDLSVRGLQFDLDRLKLDLKELKDEEYRLREQSDRLYY